MLRNLISPVFQRRFFSSQTKQIKQLRDSTGSTISECKQAIDFAQGDLEKALAFLKEKGLARADKKMLKEVREGAIGVILTENRNAATLIEMNCETDFVAKTDLFLNYIQATLIVLQNEQKLLSLNEENQQEIEYMLEHSKCPYELWPDQKEMSMKETQKLIISKLQENVQIKRIESFIGNENEQFGHYVHNVFDKKIGAIGRSACVTKNTVQKTCDQEIAQILDNLALHFLGLKPEFIKRSDIPQATLESWKNDIKEQMQDAMKGKDQNVVERIIEGKLKGIYQDKVLYNMDYLLNPEEDITVEQYINRQNKRLGLELSLDNYVLWQNNQ